VIAPPPGGFIGPVKRSVTIAGHATSISLEPIFWQVLEAQADARALPLNAVIAQIDALRIMAEDPPNLASALRSWIVANSQHSSNNFATDVRMSRNSVDNESDSQ
jgi:predicted DNA-binding ribbon-helix-helix protein